jgi:hypothetical protein
VAISALVWRSSLNVVCGHHGIRRSVVVCRAQASSVCLSLFSRRLFNEFCDGIFRRSCQNFSARAASLNASSSTLEEEKTLGLLLVTLVILSACAVR